MVKPMKYWKAVLVLCTALLFSLAASAPSRAGSLAAAAQWYYTVYGTSAPAALLAASPAQASPTEDIPAGATLQAANQVPATNNTAPPEPSRSAIWSGYSAGYGLNAGEQQLVGLVNQQRVANHEAPFTVNLKLSYLARLRARDMADHQNLTHYSPTYGTPPQMEEAAGISGNPMGAENICEGPSVAVDNSALFNSPPHRANLLDARETQIGLGVVNSGNGIVWVSELFVGP